MTMNVVKKIYTDGTVEEVEQKMSLEQMQKFVGGYIELCPTRLTRRSLIINEEGLLMDLPPNPEATKLVRPETWVVDFIRGNALLVKSR